MTAEPTRQDKALAWLLANPGATASQLSGVLGVTPGRATHILEQAETDGLTQRDRVPPRGPWQWTAVTARPRARQVLIRLAPHADLQLAGPVADLPPHELELPGCPREGEQVEHGGRWWTVKQVTWQAGMDSPLVTVF